jgi:hypothetical protein
MSPRQMNDPDQEMPERKRLGSLLPRFDTANDELGREKNEENREGRERKRDDFGIVIDGHPLSAAL